MGIPYYQVNAFTREVTGGNPAGVCILDEWLPEARMQQIAASHLLAETAFLVQGQPRLRWFTPTTEIDLCGHATLAAAHVLFQHRGVADSVIRFDSRGGPLAVRRAGDALMMDFPARPAAPARAPQGLAGALGAEPREVFDGASLLVLLESERTVRDLNPDIRALAGMHHHAVIVTAPGESADFVSRFFAPRVGVPEDHVTGSAHCMLAPWWAGRIGRKQLSARQLSARGGDLQCTVNGDRVLLQGHAVTFLVGEVRQ